MHMRMRMPVHVHVRVHRSTVTLKVVTDINRTYEDEELLHT